MESYVAWFVSKFNTTLTNICLCFSHYDRSPRGHRSERYDDEDGGGLVEKVSMLSTAFVILLDCQHLLSTENDLICHTIGKVEI